MGIVIDGRPPEQPPVQQWPRQLHVAVVSLSMGGAERIVLDWAFRIDRKWDIHLIVLRNCATEWPVPRFVRITRLQGPRAAKPMCRMTPAGASPIPQLRELGAEIAKSQNPVCVCHLLNKAERDALAEAGAQVITVLHNAREGWPEGPEHISGSTRTIAVSDACMRDLRESGWDGPATVIRHIPPRRNPPPNACQDFRRAWNIPQHATVIGMVGAVKPQKDYPFALRILSEVLRHRDAYLAIIGGPVNTRQVRSPWESLVAEVHRLGLRNRVAMPGFIAYATRCLPAFDILLNTSRYEGLSMATLEALLAGKPVVASRVGGQGEMASPNLILLQHGAPPATWASAILRRLDLTPHTPTWADFPSYRLWTLAALARKFEPSTKTLFVTANLNSGGAQRSLVNLAMQIRRRLPFEIMVLAKSTTSHFMQQLQDAAVPLTMAGSAWDAFTFAENIVQKACSQRIGTICFWNADPRVKLLVAKALDFTRIRLVDVSPGDSLYEEMDATATFQDLIAYSSQQYYSRINSLVMKYHGPVPRGCEHKAVAIPNGITRTRKVKANYAINGAPRIAVNGRIAPAKFCIEIVSAIRLVWEKFPEAELHFFGGAETLHRKYADQLLANAQDDRIRFHGVEFNVRDRLPEFDAYVVLGKNQGCPNALMEALSVGMPSIANDDGGTREQVMHNKTGLLLRGTSPEELAAAIVRILSDRDLAARLGRAGREHVDANFTINRMADEYVALLTGGEPLCATLRKLARRATAIAARWTTEGTTAKQNHAMKERTG